MAARGGKRAGAGRKPTKLSQATTPLKRVTAEEILAEVDEKAYWHDLLTATTLTQVTVITITEDGKPTGEPTRENMTVPDYRIRLDALKYVTDRRDGKAPQQLQHTGPDGKEPTINVLVRHIGNGNGSPAKAARVMEAME